MIEQYAGDSQEEVWDAITKAAADAGGGWKPLSLSNVVLLTSGQARGELTSAWSAASRP
jgi:hypothetical protein